MSDGIIRDFPERPGEQGAEPRRFVAVGAPSDVPPGGARRFVVEGRPIAVFDAKGRYLACKDRCPHMAAALSQGRLEGESVVCWQHGWKIDLNDGACAGHPRARLEVYAVRVRDGVLEVELPEPH